MPDTGLKECYLVHTLRPMLSDSASDPPYNPPGILEPWTSTYSRSSILEQEELVQLSIRRVIAMCARMCAVSDCPQLG